MSEIKDITEGTIVEGRYYVRDIQFKPFRNKDGQFLDITLGDKTGQIKGKLWDADTEVAKKLAPGQVVHIVARVDSYKETPQLVLTRQPEIIPPDQYDIGDFLPCTEADRDELLEEVNTAIKKVVDPYLRALLDAIFTPEFTAAFYKAPAAKGHHHAYIGGLLEHTVGVLRVAEAMAKIYPVDEELLVAGAILHDIGKIWEYTYDTNIDVSDDGQLLGHIMMGAQMVTESAATIEGFPAERMTQLHHMILSHHGNLEWGSPKRPVFLEAELLHLADLVDSRAAMFIQASKENTPWVWVKGLDRNVMGGKLGDG